MLTRLLSLLFAALSTSGPAGPARFSPQYPLWSDGAEKERRVWLPPGATIDVSDPDHWVFPDGTRFWKDFIVAGRKVETRELKKVAGSWEFATFQWNAAGTEMTRVPDAGAITDVEVAPGKRYRIPSITECKACHVSSRVEILGFNALQLSPDRDPNALHASPLRPGDLTLATLEREGRFSPAHPEWMTAPPRIAAPNPQTRAVLGYLSANCGSCHNPDSELAPLGLHLKASAVQAPQPSAPCAATLGLLARTGLDRPGKWKVPGLPPDLSRIVTPGEPGHSALLARMSSRRPSSQMPAMGTQLVDTAAVTLLTDWITTLSICRSVDLSIFRSFDP